MQNEPKALAKSLGLPDPPHTVNGMLEVEVTGVAAAVSGMIEMTQSIYKQVGDKVFELVNSPVWEEACLKRAFLKHSGTPEEKRDDFWALLRTKNCTALTSTLIVTLSRMAELGINLVHEGVPVKHFGMLNGMVDLGACGGTQDIRIKIGASRKAKVIGIHGTHAQHQVIRNLNAKDRNRYFPWAKCGLPSRNIEVETAHRREACTFGLKDENDIIVHYWTMLQLENGDTVHIDLCGPTYGIFEYRNYDGKDVPVSVRKAVAGSFQFFPVNMANSVCFMDQISGKVSGEGLSSRDKYLVHCLRDVNIPDWFGFSLLRKGVMTFNFDSVDVVFGSPEYKQMWQNFNSVSERVVRACRAAVGNRVKGIGLKVAARLNSKKGIVKKAGDYSNEEERWEVLFEGETEIVKIKPRNLQLGN